MEYQLNSITPIKPPQEINMTDLESGTCIKIWGAEFIIFRLQKEVPGILFGIISTWCLLPLDCPLQCIRAFLYSLPVIWPSYWHVYWLWQTFRAKSALGCLTRLRTMACNTIVGMRGKSWVSSILPSVSLRFVAFAKTIFRKPDYCRVCEFLTVINIKFMIFWDVKQWSSVQSYGVGRICFSDPNMELENPSTNIFYIHWTTVGDTSKIRP
jgi:hypothetical protein